ncbi:MAG: hypothetical protein OXU36_16300 [Candidatus Poribacteria bacterium]|nr:hypothetical protein [Candidatus Poribacteria bacterium]
MLKSFFLILVVIFLAGCASTTTTTRMSDDEFDAKLLKTMKTWEGSHISQLIQKLGPPTYKTPDEAGGTIYIWMIDPASLPPLREYTPLYPPSTQTPPRSVSSAINQFLHQETVRRRIQSRNQHKEFRQKILAMKRMFYVRSDGTIYLAHLMYH